MKLRTLILRSAAYHWRSHLGTLLAAAAGTAVLVGALLVGDSVRGSLKDMALERLGNVQYALITRDRFFNADLSRRIAERPVFSNYFNRAESALLLPGVCASGTSNASAPGVQVLGVSETFWQLGNGGPPAPPARDEAVLNQKLADALGVKVGDTVRLRIYKPGLLSLDALGSKEDKSSLLRARVKSVISDHGLGRFDLSASQVAPYNAFVPLADLQEKLAQGERANLLLLAVARKFDGQRDQYVWNLIARQDGDVMLDMAWNLSDSQLRLRVEPKLNFVEVSTPRVFLDDTVADDMLGRPTGLSRSVAPLTTYFVNAIRCGKRETPYSMVTACVAPLVDAELKDDEIILNEWTAEDLQAKLGDSIELEYFVIGPLRKLETRKAAFKVKAIVPIAELHADRGLMPDFPGIAEVESTHDWNAGVPIDMKKIRPKDEAYWKQYRGTSKAFITLNRGKELWRDRFGTYTALRYPINNRYNESVADIAKFLRQEINPEHLGLSLVPVREQALAAAGQATDFGTLFLGMSFFLIAAAVLLMALLFQFTIASRAGETGILLALGFTPKRVRNLLWAEGVTLAAAGSLLGVAGGCFYAKLLLAALVTRWRSAVGTSALEFHAETSSYWIGCLTGIFIAAFAIALAVRRQASRPAHDLLTQRGASEETSRSGGGRLWPVIGALSLFSALFMIVFYRDESGPSTAGAFFGAGALLLVSALIAVRFILTPYTDRTGSNIAASGTLLGLGRLGIRSSTRRRGRSLAAASLLACGSFLIVAVGANQQDAALDAGSKDSGTGGFALYAQSTIPILQDLNTPVGRAAAGVSVDAFEGMTLYPLRAHAGDEASCLNLNRAQRPRVAGLPEAFIHRGGFTFAESLTPLHPGTNPWEMLRRTDSAGPIPAVMDIQSLAWALHLKVGDELSVDDEHGAPQRLRIVGAIANSILQGSVLIAEDEFLKLYPSESGYRVFLADAPQERAREIGARLSAALADEGYDAQPAVARLAEFNAVANTYLDTFQALGGLGLLLGSMGLGVVLMRNVLERRGELALLRALGFSRRAIDWLVFSEHAWILLLGLSAGALSSLAAILPGLKASSSPLPWQSLLFTLLAISAAGLLSSLAAAWLMLRTPLLTALRND